MSTKQLCSVETTDSLINYGRTHQYANKIPKIVHYVYRTNYIPTQYSSHVKDCVKINNDTKFVFWSDFLAYRLIINHFHNYRYLYSSYFHKGIHSLKISDVIRYFILYKFGGIYMDFDTKCQQPFNTVMINNSCIMSQEVNEQTRILYNIPYLAMNSLMATTSNHDFFNFIIGKLTKADGSYILSQTGPMFLTNTFDAYRKLQTNMSYLLQPITLADPYIYSPHTEVDLEIQCKWKPKGYWQMQGCQNLKIHRKLQINKTKEAVAVHLFMHLGYGKIKLNMVDNICLVIGNITLVSI